MFHDGFMPGRKTMRNRGLVFAAAALTGMLLTSGAGAQQPWPPVGTKVDIYGCVSRSLDNLCPIIKDRKTGQLYTITSANPQPDPAKKLVVHLNGTIASYVTFCWSGPFLDNIKWQYTRLRCPRPK
jgi:hypothetical protein